LDESHVAIAWRTVDSHAIVHQALAGLVDIVDLIGEMTEIAAALIVFRVPVVGQFQKRGLRRGAAMLVLGRGEEDQSEAALLVFGTANFRQSELLHIGVERYIEVLYANHCVQIAHVSFPHFDWWRNIGRWAAGSNRIARFRSVFGHPDGNSLGIC